MLEFFFLSNFDPDAVVLVLQVPPNEVVLCMLWAQVWVELCEVKGVHYSMWKYFFLSLVCAVSRVCFGRPFL